jgi:flagellar motility protein MotE (MotC chaperone)
MRKGLLFIVCLFLCLFYLLPIEPLAGQDDTLMLVEKKKKELKEKEESLRKEEERLNILKKEIDEKIDRYSKLLSEIEDALKEIKKARDERFEQVVRAYETMPPEEAAARLSELDEKTATRILSMMKPKKASAIMAAMEPKKVAVLTERILKIEKKFPGR